MAEAAVLSTIAAEVARRSLCRLPEQHERLVGDPQAYSFHTAGLPRLGLSAAEAATFIGISTTFFRRLVDDGTMPCPRVLGSRRLWSAIELSAAFSMLRREGEAQERRDPWSDIAV